jgi:hypothetical protein
MPIENSFVYVDVFAAGVTYIQRCEECVLCPEHKSSSAGDRAAASSLNSDEPQFNFNTIRVRGISVVDHLVVVEVALDSPICDVLGRVPLTGMQARDLAAQLTQQASEITWPAVSQGDDHGEM